MSRRKRNVKSRSRRRWEKKERVEKQGGKQGGQKRVD